MGEHSHLLQHFDGRLRLPWLDTLVNVLCSYFDTCAKTKTQSHHLGPKDPRRVIVKCVSLVQ